MQAHGSMAPTINASHFGLDTANATRIEWVDAEYKFHGVYTGGEIWHEDWNPGHGAKLKDPCPTGPGVVVNSCSGRPPRLSWVRPTAAQASGCPSTRRGCTRCAASRARGSASSPSRTRGRAREASKNTFQRTAKRMLHNVANFGQHTQLTTCVKLHEIT